ncbi:hypothetical protein J7394_17945 [Ruegeria sp. R13_0]|uniref:hypothetical protein n=1 Tax=Ruegeria sp. R13_0 TaxID=2821099 RepID=UPI001ADCE297|nr:hypothetical protein [Ruegeria sp. R13_0]MBO9436109.1 hypothetical protein [Ruegeria sp. R13_0]
MRRVLLHLGLHKTGTTVAQSFLYKNRQLIWPHFSLILPYKTRKTGIADIATRHSIYRLHSTLAEFETGFRALLDPIDFGTRRGLILSEENFAGLRPSRNSAEGYGATPELATTLVEQVTDRLGPVDLTIYLSLRQREDWLRSLWAHDLRRTRLVQDYDEFREALNHLPSPKETADTLQDRLPLVKVQTEWMEDLRKRRFGPGAPFATFLNLPRDKMFKLVAPEPHKARPTDEVLLELLELNRSALDDAALMAQKKALIKRAKDDLVSQS